MKLISSLKSLLIIGLLIPSFSYSAKYYSRNGGGGWGVAATWSTASCGGAAAAGIPGAGDTVYVCNGDVVNVDAAFYQCLALDVTGTINWSSAGYILQVLGTGVTIQNGGIVGGGGTTAGHLICTSTTTVPVGAGATIGGINYSTTTGTTISGTLTFTSVSGSKSFQGISVSNGGKIDFTAAEVLNMSTDLTMNGTADVSGSAQGVFVIDNDFVVASGANCTVGGVYLNITKGIPS